MGWVETVTGKLNRFSRDPLGTVATRVRMGVNAIKSLVPPPNYQQLLRKVGVYDDILEFAAKRPADSIAPVFDDLWFLWSTVRKRKPNVILEFGSGVSTVVLARAVQANGRGFVFSVDSCEAWLRSTRESMPRNLRGCYDITYSPVKVEPIAGTPTFRHERIPDITPNLVYLDGPPLTDEVQAASDVLFMEDRLPDDFYLIVDGRPLNFKYLYENLKRSYRFEYREEHFNGVIELISEKTPQRRIPTFAAPWLSPHERQDVRSHRKS